MEPTEPVGGGLEALPAVAPSPQALRQSTGFLLSTAGRIVRERFERALQPLGLRARHFGVLTALVAGGPLPQGVAAARLGLDKSAMVAIINDLEALGLVERRRNPADRRAYALVPTDAGRAKLGEVAAAVPDFGEEWLSPLDDAEREQLRALLARLLFAPGGWLAGESEQSR